MKNLDPAPIDAGRDGQRIQELKLRCPGGGYQTGASLIGQRPPERARGMIGCGLAQRVLVCKNFYLRLQHRVRLASSFLSSCFQVQLVRCACCFDRWSPIATGSLHRRYSFGACHARGRREDSDRASPLRRWAGRASLPTRAPAPATELPRSGRQRH
jgi:hypothetical protein